MKNYFASTFYHTLRLLEQLVRRGKQTYGYDSRVWDVKQWSKIICASLWSIEFAAQSVRCLLKVERLLDYTKW